MPSLKVRPWAGAPRPVGAAACGVFLLGALAIIERRSRDPLLPTRLLTSRNLRAAGAIAFLFMATFGSVLYFLSLYFQDVHHYNALETGVAFLLRTAVVVAGSAAGGRMVTRVGSRAARRCALRGRPRCRGPRSLDVTSEFFRRADSGTDRAQHRDGVVFTTMFIVAGTGVPDREQASRRPSSLRPQESVRRSGLPSWSSSPTPERKASSVRTCASPRPRAFVRPCSLLRSGSSCRFLWR